MNVAGRLALLTLLLAAAPARAQETTPAIDLSALGTNNRAELMQFITGNAGRLVRITALVPTYPPPNSGAEKRLDYGWDGPQERAMARFVGGFRLSRMSVRAPAPDERVYLLDGFFRIARKGRGGPKEGVIYEVAPARSPSNAALETRTPLSR